MYIHSFPDRKKNPEMYAKWVESVNKNAPVKFVPTEATRICSEHFRSDMKEEGGQKVILTPFAVPTIFTTSQVCVFVIFSLYNVFVFDSLTCFNVPRTSLLTLKVSVPVLSNITRIITKDKLDLLYKGYKFVLYDNINLATHQVNLNNALCCCLGCTIYRFTLFSPLSNISPPPLLISPPF